MRAPTGTSSAIPTPNSAREATSSRTLASPSATIAGTTQRPSAPSTSTRSRAPDRSSRSRSTRPAATILPRLTIATLSQMRSTSSS
jgi:hypothetical protein